MASPMSRGLFHGAITESGGCDTNLMISKAEAYAKRGAESMGCPTSSGQLECLRSRNASVLVNLSNVDLQLLVLNTWPVVDGASSGLPDTQLRLLRSGRGSRVPWLIGHNTDEFFIACRKGQRFRECNALKFLADSLGVAKA